MNEDLDKANANLETITFETITLGGGCFWCLEAVYDEVQGVTDVVSGYAGGHTLNPTYKLVCSETTGHAEVVQIQFDPQQISTAEILGIFFSIHDPTTLNRQGNDVGSSYRSCIFTRNPAQQEAAQHAKQEAAALWERPIVTEIKPLETFYPAEDYHQEYFKQNPGQGYCMMVVAPKVAKFRKNWTNKLKSA
jgi:peptide-methionine (S)-S-oxide reductase